MINKNVECEACIISVAVKSRATGQSNTMPLLCVIRLFCVLYLQEINLKLV